MSCLLDGMKNFIMQIATISSIGKTIPASIPAFILSFAFCVKMPITLGPIDAPRSPPIASKANRAVPPMGIRAEEMLIEPGHMIPTENPQRIQPSSPKIGREEIAVIK